MSDSHIEPGLVICVSGPSGVGKGTVIKQAMRLRPDLAHSVSVTTREARPGEQEGVDYYFRSRDQFLAMLEAGNILEYDQYCDHFYGTPREQLEHLVRKGRDILMDITVPGSLAVMKSYPACITLFLMPPSFSELQCRLEKRGTECSEIVRKRLDKARDEIALANRFQYIVINDDLDLAARRILAIIDAEHCRYHRLAGLEATILAR
ncbi:MAG: guanylate kinase [Clostridiaceae bacterium]|nr:guanylate kinase [Clostridiaceae bacterium]